MITAQIERPTLFYVWEDIYLATTLRFASAIPFLIQFSLSSILHIRPISLLFTESLGPVSKFAILGPGSCQPVGQEVIHPAIPPILAPFCMSGNSSVPDIPTATIYSLSSLHGMTLTFI